MSEYVGRTGALRVYSYPETGRGRGAAAFARNFATGTKGAFAIDPAGSNITWNSIDVGTDPSEDVPITPLSTGEVLITGIVTLTNPTGAPILASVTPHVDGSAAGPSFAATTIPAGATVSIPFIAETAILSLSQHLIQIFVDGDGLTTVSDGSTINVQEVSVSTG